MIAVYTAIIGDYDDLKDPIVQSNCDYICFADHNIKSNVWKIVSISNLDLGRLSNVRKARYIKTHPHTLLKEYDKTIWVDANLFIKDDLLKLVDSSSFKLFKHPFRDCIYDEAVALSTWHIDTQAINRWLEVLKREGYPKHAGLVETNFMIRDNSEMSIELDECWWAVINSYSYRDQMSLNYLIWKYKYDVNISDIVIRNSQYIELVKHNGR